MVRLLALLTRLAGAKSSGLFGLFVSDEDKTFYSIDARLDSLALSCLAGEALKKLFTNKLRSFFVSKGNVSIHPISVLF